MIASQPVATSSKPVLAYKGSNGRLPRRNVLVKAATGTALYPPFIPPVIRDIGDAAAHAMISKMRREPVQVDSLAKQGEGSVRTAVVGPTGAALDEAGVPTDAPVMVMLHSFDSSSIEWRRLYPMLEQNAGMPVVAVDLIGWGFTDVQAWQRKPLMPLGADLKREHLEAFRQQQLGGRPVVLVGTSLGGTIAADYALAYPQAVKQLILIDAQGFTEGVKSPPRFLSWIGVAVLKTVWLRNQANQQAYHDKATFATEDAWKCGRLHTFLPGWQEANVAFISSGGYSLTEERIKQLSQPVLLLWGKSDEILPIPLADKWQAALSTRPQGSGSFMRVDIDRAGHSPHLERPDAVAEPILQFLTQQQQQQQREHEQVARV
uniref:AB hydrolase-1 domain-containing protein n=1 Tax=Dunaliella tertiolecta TaxID=3047 RepID=A0A7S3R5K7_DUNTE|mmetsp:Transcript_4653/g.12720  ORF Transcript_4653/g.12720 Transcript_4653/m.12720 type:complete len:376 (+) Transcript_4653:118-1245(+)